MPDSLVIASVVVAVLVTLAVAEAEVRWYLGGARERAGVDAPASGSAPSERRAA